MARNPRDSGPSPRPSALPGDHADPEARIRRVFRKGLIGLSGFTLVVDVLLLVQPLYMLQVYDRILPSRSVETLIYISLIAACALILLGMVDSIRSLLASRLAAALGVEAGADALIAALEGPQARLGDVQPLRDLGTVRGFIAGKGILAYLDLPFAPLFILLLYLIHPHLFVMTALGAVVLMLIAWANQYATTTASARAGDASIAAMLSAQAFARSQETIKAMGMTSDIIAAWGRKEAASLRLQDQINRINGGFAGLSRTLRLGLQIAILGYGGYLVVEGEMTAGMIFASSLISARGLQPIDQVIAGWRGFAEARKAWIRLKAALQRGQRTGAATDLPAPLGWIRIEHAVVAAPRATASVAPLPILNRISAEIAAGECVAIIGPSGSGKSTLVRAIVGTVDLSSGVIRIDGADIRTWDRARLGRHIGYLSQEVDLLPGTVAENIARFSRSHTAEAIVAAAHSAHVHDLILALPQGYDTPIGPAGQKLSGGQRQRIGLARAFFGSPSILVLDEPNANLDSEGESALEKAVLEARMAKTTVLMVTQRRQIAERADRILIMRAGSVVDFGPRAEVLARQQRLGGQQSPAG